MNVFNAVCGGKCTKLYLSGMNVKTYLMQRVGLNVHNYIFQE